MSTDAVITKTLTVHIHHLKPFPIKGAVSMDDEGKLEIWVNDALSEADKKEVVIHEMLHILNEDFLKKDVQEIEARCHQETKDIMESICR